MTNIDTSIDKKTNSRARFVKIECKETIGGDNYEWTEWFCPEEVWCNPYNRDGRYNRPKWDKMEEFQKWCDSMQETDPERFGRWGSVCPNITIGGAVLYDGWGSDLDGRICNGYGYAAQKKWGDCLEDALRTGEVTTIRLDNGKKKVMETIFTPYESITPDADSVAEFGEWADAALEGLV